MDFLKSYVDLYEKSYLGELLLSTLVTISLLTFPVCRLLGKPLPESLLLSLFAGLMYYSLFLLPHPHIFRIERTEKEVYLHYSQEDAGGNWALKLFGISFPYGIRKLLTFFGDSTKDITKDASGFLLQRMVRQYELRLYSPSARIPDRKILITNHVHKPLLDAISFFPFCRRGMPMIVLQHDFHWIVTVISNWCWGAFTIDKDDKTPEGKRRLLGDLSRLMDQMKRTENLTVVIYAQGKVPKSSSETRSPTKFYPGAFYLSLMTGYPIVPLVSDFDGVKFTSSCRQPVYLREELEGRFIDEPDLERFREINKEVIDGQTERFRAIFRGEYERIKKREKWICETKRGVRPNEDDRGAIKRKGG